MRSGFSNRLGAALFEGVGVVVAQQVCGGNLYLCRRSHRCWHPRRPAERLPISARLCQRVRRVSVEWPVCRCNNTCGEPTRCDAAGGALVARSIRLYCITFVTRPTVTVSTAASTASRRLHSVRRCVPLLLTHPPLCGRICFSGKAAASDGRSAATDSCSCWKGRRSPRCLRLPGARRCWAPGLSPTTLRHHFEANR